jgi:hypothetical protein
LDDAFFIARFVSAVSCARTERASSAREITVDVDGGTRFLRPATFRVLTGEVEMLKTTRAVSSVAPSDAPPVEPDIGQFGNGGSSGSGNFTQRFKQS